MCNEMCLSQEWFSSRIKLENSIISIRNHLPNLSKSDRERHLRSLESYNAQLINALDGLDFVVTDARNKDLTRVYELSEELSKLIMVYQ